VRKINRTANCPKCGSVKLRISPSNGKAQYFCSECGLHIQNIMCETFTSVSSKCEDCGKDIFKVKIEEKEEKICWTPFCIECNGQPNLICIDDAGNEFNLDKREQLVITNSMNLFESRLLKLENSFCVFNEKVEKLKNSMKKNNYKPLDIDN
jgi:predicted RNA-binding Zn-ribbon protein involved in translation (DUF1610 family)